jgi:hypothetical protein
MRFIPPRIVWSAAVGVALALALPAGTSRADLVLDLSVDEMARAATAVVHGTVTRVGAAWDDSHTRIYTDVEIDVAAYLAGRGPDRVRIRQVGGRVGETELRVAGQPSFAVGEEVVVFLEPDGSEAPDRWVVTCMAAGKFTVTFDRLTGERIVGRDVRGLVSVERRAGAAAATNARVARPFTFGELEATVRRATGGGR